MIRPSPATLPGIACLIAFALATPARAQTSTTIAITGTIREAGSGQPIAYATVQAEGTSRATHSNEEGKYRLLVDSRQANLKFSHIAYHPKWVPIPSSDSLVKVDVELELTALEGDSVVVTARALDPGKRIIAEAIRRKHDILERVRDYTFDAYSKFVVNDLDVPDSAKIWMLTETQSTSYWQRPAKYREVITARKQTANLEAADNLITVGEFLNFNKNRIEIGAYSMVSPLADDALSHYNYYLLDTVLIDSRPAFRLEIEPLNPDEPRFVGEVYVADSTYDVLDLNVGLSRGASFPMVVDLRYRLRYARFLNEYWLPVEVRLTGVANLPAGLPGIPSKLGFGQFASITNYQLDPGLPGSTFGDVQIEVADGADKYDSAAWYQRQAIPLTETEVQAYHRIDSLEHIPAPVGKRVLQGTAAAAALMLGAESDFFRFNRVEDAYLGLGGSPHLGRHVDLRVKAGYSFGTHMVEHQLGGDYRFASKWRFMLGFDYELRTVARSSITTSSTYNPSTLSLLTQLDPFNYYQTQDVEVHASLKPFSYHRLTLFYHDEAHRSLPVTTDYRMFVRDHAIRDNPFIVDGNLRSLEARWVYDNRPLYRQEGRDVMMDATEYTRITFGAEVASPDLIDNDFEFTRLYAHLQRRQQTLGLGITRLDFYAGSSGGTLPPQRFFAADYGKGIFFNRGAFQTFDEQSFGGGRAVSATLYHNFRKLLFTRTGWPVIKDIPFWLSVHGSIMWADFANLTPLPGDELAFTTDHPYSELGFGVENLLPFLEPANVSVHFTWQLSSYDTRNFVALLALRM